MIDFLFLPLLITGVLLKIAFFFAWWWFLYRLALTTWTYRKWAKEGHKIGFWYYFWTGRVRIEV